jgi:hypothetical protein
MTNFAPNAEISLEEGLNLYNLKMQQAQHTLQVKGFAMPRPPMVTTTNGVQQGYRGELPPDLTQLNDSQLGTYMGLLSEWNTYVQVQLAEADMNLSKCKSDLSLVEAKLRILYQKDPEGKKRSNPERDDYVGSDRRFIESQAEVTYWETVYRYIRAIGYGAENAFSAVSRRITQRGQEVDRMNRTAGVTGGSNIPSGAIFGNARR